MLVQEVDNFPLYDFSTSTKFLVGNVTSIHVSYNILGYIPIVLYYWYYESLHFVEIKLQTEPNADPHATAVKVTTIGYT